MKNSKLRITLAILFVVLVIIVATFYLNNDSIIDIKNPDKVGKTVRIKGEVVNVLKIGSLSGFTLKDETGSISVSSIDLPSEGEKVSVRGILLRDSIFGYYVKMD